MIAAATPALWGACGAFIYAAPRLVACFLHARDTGGGWWICALEFIIHLIIGAIAAAAFAALALTALHVRDQNAVATFCGLLANRVDAAKMIGNIFNGEVAKAIMETKRK